MRRISGIYCIENTVNGKKYIGMAANIAARWRSHKCNLRKGKHVNQHLQRAWDKYGESAFSFYVVEELPEDELCDAEIAYIEKLDTFGHGYNLTAGGDGQFHRHLTDAQKKHLSEINTGEKNPNWGRKRSVETRRRMSEAAKKVKHGQMSEECKAAISKALKGKKRPEYCKPVYWVETRKTFPSVSQAAVETGISISAISRVCRGVCKSTRNQHFEFIKEVENADS